MTWSLAPRGSSRSRIRRVLVTPAASGIGCAASATSTDGPASGAPFVTVVVTATPTATPSPSPTPIPETVEAALKKLSAAGLPVGESITYTAETDPNNLLGRPNGYEGKINFRDTRLMVERVTEFDTGDGGSLEFFPSAAGATSRKDYIQSLGKASPLFTEYDYVNGRILLRLSARLTPAQAAEYEKVLKTLQGN